MFLVFEGLDGSGKSTQIDLLSTYLFERGWGDDRVEVVAEPGTTPFGLSVRELLLGKDYAITARGELMLYEAARAQVTDERIIPALEAGKLVIADRYSLSSVAYQGYGRRLDLRRLKALDRWATRQIQPDLTLLLDIPVDAIGKRQGRAYKRDRLEREDLAFFERVRRGYRREIAKVDGGHALDGTLAPEALFASIRGIVDPLLDGA